MTVVMKAVTALSMVIALAACTDPAPERTADPPVRPTDGTPAASPPSTRRPPAPPGKYSVAQLRGALMTTADLPEGWTTSTAGKVSPETYQSGCAALDEINHSRRTKAEATFTRGAKGPVIGQALVSTTPAEATAMLAGVDRVVRDCPAIDMQTSGPPMSFAVTHTALAPMGDDSDSLRLSGPGATFDNVFVRRGGVVLVIAIVTSGPGPDRATITAIARTALTRADQRLHLTG
jgi:hypothetical protein